MFGLLAKYVSKIRDEQESVGTLINRHGANVTQVCIGQMQKLTW